MSLLNDMLRDLSHQQTPLGPSSHSSMSAMPLPDQEHRQLFNQSSVAKPVKRTWLPSLLVFTVVFIILLVWQQFFNQHQKTDKVAPTVIAQPITVATIQPEKPEAIITPTDNAVAVDIEQTNAGAIPVIVESPALQVASVTPEQQLQIYELLQQASRALTLERLTAPIEDNAYYYYQKILELDKHNPAAAQGLLKIADRYLAMAETKFQELDTEGASILIQRAKWVAPGYDAILSYEAQLSQLQLSAQNNVQDESPIPDASFLNHEPATEPVNENIAVPVTGETEQVASENSVSIEEPFVTDTAPQHLSVTPNQAWQDQQRVQQARILHVQGNSAAAISLLQKYIATTEKPLLATQALLDIYCQLGLKEDVKKLLATATYLTPVEQTYYAAKLALLNNNEPQAIILLERQFIAAERYENYRALLAGLYQRAGNYEAAASHYRRLIAAFGEKPAYWLGFALALDATGQGGSALQAYQRLTGYGDLQAEVRTYIDQRIAVLTP